MAFNFGAAATGVGSLADAFEANRRQALEERRQKVMDAQQAQRERYQNAYQQALINQRLLIGVLIPLPLRLLRVHNLLAAFLERLPAVGLKRVGERADTRRCGTKVKRHGY